MTSTQLQNSGYIRVLIADGSPLILTGIRTAFAAEADLTIVGEATNSTEVQRLSQKLEPDILLLGLEMLNISPLEAVAHLNQHCIEMKIAILTDGNNDIAIRDLVVAGITGCILKTEPTEAIVQAIRSAAQGGTWLSQSIVAKLAQGSVQAEVPNLTEEELVALRLVVAGKIDRQISQELSISERTVRYRLQNIYDKLGVNSRIEAAVKAVRLGLA